MRQGFGAGLVGRSATNSCSIEDRTHVEDNVLVAQGSAGVRLRGYRLCCTQLGSLQCVQGLSALRQTLHHARGTMLSVCCVCMAGSPDCWLHAGTAAGKIADCGLHVLSCAVGVRRGSMFVVRCVWEET